MASSCGSHDRTMTARGRGPPGKQTRGIKPRRAKRQAECGRCCLCGGSGAQTGSGTNSRHRNRKPAWAAAPFGRAPAVGIAGTGEGRACSARRAARAVCADVALAVRGPIAHPPIMRRGRPAQTGTVVQSRRFASVRKGGRALLDDRRAAAFGMPSKNSSPVKRSTTRTETWNFLM